MNILFIHHVADLYGSSRCLLRLAVRMVAEGHTVTSTLQEDGPLKTDLEKAGVHVVIVPELPALHRSRLVRPAGWFYLLRSIFSAHKKIKTLVSDLKPDVIHTNSAALLPVAGAVARSASIPHVQHIRESFLDFGIIWRIYRMILVHYSTRIICISDYIAGMFTEKQRNTLINVVYDGLPREDFEGITQHSIDAFMNQYTLRHPLIALVGRIKLQRKGQDVLVLAAERLKPKYPTASFILVGCPFPGNESHLDRLREMIAERGLQDSVILSGYLAKPHVALAACDISIMASSHPEPLGNVTIESMALGKPVIGTDCGATAEILQHGETGLLVPPNDPKSMATAIDELLSNESDRINMGTKARQQYQKRFEFEHHYETVFNLYKDVSL